MKLSQSTHTFAALLIATAGLPLAASAATLDIGTSTDTYIRYGSSGSTANTVQNSTNLILVGDTATNGDDIRGLLTFDLSSYSELVGATINSATITFTINDSDETGAGKSNNETISLNLYQTDTSFIEGQATWNSSSTGVSWGTPGGDLDTLVASTTGNPGSDLQGTTLDFSGIGLNSSITNSIGSSVSFILTIDPTKVDGLRSIFRLSSNSLVLGGGVTSDFAPVLSVDYTAAVPEPSNFALLAGVSGMACMALRRRRK